MIFIAVLNGTLRDLWYAQYIGDQVAHQVSTIFLIILFTFYFLVVFKKYPIASKSEAIKVGVLWMLLTLIFEFSFGFYRDLSLSELLADYNLSDGRLWILVPLWLLIAPSIFYKFKTK